MEEYINLLEKEEWKNKRLEIINRDNFTCQRCGINESNFKATEVFFFTGNYKVKVIKEALVNHLEITTKKNHEFKLIAKADKIPSPNSAFILFINFIDKSFKEKKFEGSLIDNKFYGIEDYSPEINNADLINNEINNFTIDLNGIWIKDPRDNNPEVIKEIDYLNIHHKCYRTNKEVWDQDNSEYTTVCNVCHKITHENYKIPFFDEYNNVLNNLIPCYRCYGKGYLPEFSHVIGGTCFRCYGTGHEKIQQ